jgi:hypothetical protein
MIRLARWARAFWQSFWFEPSTPINLAASRILFYLGLFLLYLPTDFAAWGSVSDAFWMPLPLFEALRLRPLSSSELQLLTGVWRLSLLSAAAGAATRASAIVAAILGAYLMGLPHNFGHVFHFDALLAVVLVVLACSRAGDAWSIDALLLRHRRTTPDAEYTWPIRMVWVMMALVLFAAGVAKLRYGGLDWMTTRNMSLILMRSAYHTSDADPIGTIGLWMAASPVISRLLAVSAVVVELGFATALVSRRARIVFVPAAFALLVGIRIAMGPTFGGFLIVHVFWVPWDKVAAAVRVRHRAAQVESAGRA